MSEQSGDPRYKRLLDEAWELHCAKAHDYGDNLYAVERLGINPFEGVLIRMSDKWSRICNLYKLAQQGESEAVAETIIDTLRDLSAYALLAIMVGNEVPHE